MINISLVNGRKAFQWLMALSARGLLLNLPHQTKSDVCKYETILVLVGAQTRVAIHIFLGT
jgi:hypothetical protein